MVGEIVETVGSDGAVLFEDARSVKTSYEYVEGTCWDGGYLSYFLLPEGENEARLFMPRILLTDQDLTAEQLLPVVEICIAAGERNLLVIAPHLSDSAVALLVLNRDRGVLNTAMAVRSPQTGPQRDEILLDLAAITGGRYIRTGAGDRFTDVTLQDLGAARHAWVTEHAFGILGGGGSRGEIRQRVTEAKAQLRETKNDDRTCKTIQERIGKLTGAVAIIRVGAPTQSVQVELRSRIEAAVRSARSAFCHGGVPGGGAAYLSCIPVLERLRDELDGDEELGVAVLAKALAAPLRAIAVNAGAEPGLIADEGCRRGPWETFDATEKEWVDAWATGIVDPLPVALTALQASVSAATMALTIEVLVRHKNPKYALEP
jgi:chaperonin GroEL